LAVNPLRCRGVRVGIVANLTVVAVPVYCLFLLAWLRGPKIPQSRGGTGARFLFGLRGQAYAASILTTGWLSLRPPRSLFHEVYPLRPGRDGRCGTVATRALPHSGGGTSSVHDFVADHLALWTNFVGAGGDRPGPSAQLKWEGILGLHMSESMIGAV